MEESSLQKIEGWFEQLNKKVENVVTKQQFENRFQALFNTMTNLHHKIETYGNRQNLQEDEMTLLKRALHDLEQEVKNLRQQVIGQ